MRTRTIFAVLSGVMIIASACRKEKSQEGTPVEELCSYAPYYTGSSFAYTNTTIDDDVTEYSVTVTGDSTIDGKKYKMLETDLDGSIAFSRCEGGVYTQVATDVALQGYEADIIISTNLKDNVRAGSSWEDTLSADTPLGYAKLTLTYTITQKDISKTVLTETFKNVIGVRMDASATIMGFPVDLGTLATNYYAAGVGLIQVDTDSDTTRITSYTINKP
ncbi:hypothetical protein MKQ68_22645 [Chitinophaga horti]|uniref:Uncharacterized protein n=1 Tax=Chitinophaga horti TaxID=2920382 RepID=A0ABY6IZN7_9BACT|nr:hypothetical protein [Chitinophaga horti]UYQ92883.1 hypothetical protein MKQ68_22645 [Chitinophaga horti]